MLTASTQETGSNQENAEHPSSSEQQQTFHIELYEEKEYDRCEAILNSIGKKNSTDPSSSSPVPHELLQSLPDSTTDPEKRKVACIRYTSQLLKSRLKTQKELFSVLKKQFISSSSRDRLLERVFSMTPEFATQEELESAQSQRDKRKEAVKEQRAAVEAALLEISDLANIIAKGHESLQKYSAEFEQLNIEIEKAEADIAAQEPFQDQENTELLELEKEVQEDAMSLEELERKVSELETAVNEKQNIETSIKEELGQLSELKSEVSAQAEEALRIAKAKDPRLDELATWYESVSKLLRSINGIESIHTEEDGELHIRYKMADSTIYTSKIVFSGTSSPLPPFVTISISILELSTLDFADICEMGGEFASMDAYLLFVIKTSYARLCKAHLREKEMASLQEQNESIMYDATIRELLVYVEKTARTFVFRLDINYPCFSINDSMIEDGPAGSVYNQPNGIRVVAVEPAADPEEVSRWQSLLETNRIKSVSDMIPLLN